MAGALRELIYFGGLIMSYRLYFRMLMTSAHTQILNNTTSLVTYTDPGKITLVGINFEFNQDTNLTFIDSDPFKQYVDIVLPVYHIVKKETFEFIRLDRNYERANNFNAFSKSLMGMGTDYVLVYINTFGGNPVETKLLTFLETQTNTTLLRDKTTGGWMMLIRPRKKQNAFESQNFTKLLEKYSTISNINLYFLTNSEFKNMNRATWNKLFRNNSTNLAIQTHYQDYFDSIDPMIKDESSDYLQILARIRHQLVHPRDDNFDGVIEEADLELSYYDTYPEQLPSDMETIRNVVKAIGVASKESGIDILFNSTDGLILQTRSKSLFLSELMIELMLDYRNLYLTLRAEFYSKLDLS